MPELSRPPIQTETDAQPFEIQRRGVTYRVTPMHDYELYGMVVSENDFRDFWEKVHEDLKDHINVKDLCVIWGPNVESGIYQKLEFSSGEWTCYYEWKTGSDRESWAQFQPNALSNNHLLSDKSEILAKTALAKRGDQIHFKGHLVKYSSNFMKAPRISSTVREDNGCEVVYLTQLEILKKANRFWRSLFSLSGRVALVCIILFMSHFLIEIGKVVKHEGRKQNGD